MKRTGPRKRSKADKERWESAWEPTCHVCWFRRTHTCHHVVYAQHVRARGGDEWDPANALPICRICHDDHHGAVRRIPLSALSHRHYEFASELLGEADLDYFDRYYDPIEEAA